MRAFTHMQVTCTLRVASFITEKQKRNTSELPCTGMTLLRASVKLRALRVHSSHSCCIALAHVNSARHRTLKGHSSSTFDSTKSSFMSPSSSSSNSQSNMLCCSGSSLMLFCPLRNNRVLMLGAGTAIYITALASGSCEIASVFDKRTCIAQD
jgi:hypothetical protein